jgi:hypothetical protein
VAILASVATGLAAGGGGGCQDASLRPVAIRVEAGHASVRLEGVPLCRALAALAAEAGIEVATAERLEEPVSLVVEAAPLEEALGRLLRGRAHVLRLHDGKPVALWVGPRQEASAGASGPGSPASPAAGPPPREAEPASAAVVEALHAARPAARVPAIARLLRGAEAGETRRAAVEALAGLAALPVEPLLAVGRDDPDSSLRLDALLLLARRAGDDPRVHALLEAAAADDADPERRAVVELLLAPPDS